MKPPGLLASLTLFSILYTGLAPAESGDRIVTGSVIANRSVTLATRIMGRITRVHALEGERVKGDQVIVELDDTEYQARLKIAQAARERAEAELAHRERSRKRLEKLTQTNAVSQDAVDEAVYALEIAAANLKAAQAEIDAIQSTLMETRIRAPFDAVVIRKYAETGLVTQPGQALYEIQDQSKLKFRARVTERDLTNIKVDDVALVTITALGDESVSARVIRVIPYGDDRHTFLIELALPNRPGLYPGMFGKAIFR
ncbi:MAG: efflux RND transporter periplasmic adaptor subunit [Gammaproteobacteria bacterium]|nr:efflux RND transporter periplasmic adaptor subunit [Gammaproteobacteria bacterium]MDH3537866.1 efflux RND transporter periplasmic adaptor subunit [Gammaproteobacteria bacterium]